MSTRRSTTRPRRRDSGTLQGARPLVVGAASVLISRRRALALAALIVGLVVFGAVASRLPGLSEDGAVVVASLVVLPVLLASVWLALPVAQGRDWLLLSVTVLAGLAWAGFYVLDFEELSNTSKLVAFVLFGFWFLTLFVELWWLAIVAFLVPGSTSGRWPSGRRST